jgi:hypothetical protein
MPLVERSALSSGQVTTVLRASKEGLEKCGGATLGGTTKNAEDHGEDVDDAAAITLPCISALQPYGVLPN